MLLFLLEFIIYVGRNSEIDQNEEEFSDFLVLREKVSAINLLYGYCQTITKVPMK